MAKNPRKLGALVASVALGVLCMASSALALGTATPVQQGGIGNVGGNISSTGIPAGDLLVGGGSAASAMSLITPGTTGYVLTSNGAGMSATFQALSTPSGFATTSADYWISQRSTTNLPEGTNLYFTNARAVTALTGQNISIFTNNSGFTTLGAFSAGTGLSYNGSGIFSLSNTAVTATSYTNANITVNAQGQITSASNGSAGSGYPFAGTGNSTSTLTQFNGGLTSYASTTIGSGGTTNGLTVNGTATTTNFIDQAITSALSLFNSAHQETAYTGTNPCSANQAIVSLSATGVGSCSSTFLTGNQSITLSGDVSGSGSTAITTTIGSNKVTVGDLAQAAANTLLGNPTGATGNIQAVATSTLNIGGNAGTATALQNARTINTVSFNGTANIVITAASSSLLTDNNTFSGSFFDSNATSTILNLTTVNSTSTNATTTNEYVSGQLKNGSGTGLALETSGVFSAYGGATSCTNQFFTGFSSVGASTCGSVSNADWSGTQLSVANGGTNDTSLSGNSFLYTNAAGTQVLTAASSSLDLPNTALQNSTVGATSPNSTLTFGSAAALGATFTGDINLNNSNQWTASTTFTKVVNEQNASTSLETVGTQWNTAITSALVSVDANHKESAYGGASACSSNNFVTTISALGATTCGTASISGVSLGSSLFSLTNSDGSLTLSGGYNGSAANTVSVNTGHSNGWSVLQSFANASSTLASIFSKLYVGGTSTTTIDSAGNVVLPSAATLTLGGITGSTQCLHVNSSGVVSGTGSDCGSGGGSVSSVANSDGTLTISPTSGSVVASLALSHSNTWTALQSFSNASSTLSSVFSMAYFGGTATTTIDSAGDIAVPSGSFISINRHKVYARWKDGINISAPTTTDETSKLGNCLEPGAPSVTIDNVAVIISTSTLTSTEGMTFNINIASAFSTTTSPMTLFTTTANQDVYSTSTQQSFTSGFSTATIPSGYCWWWAPGTASTTQIGGINVNLYGYQN